MVLAKNKVGNKNILLKKNGEVITSTLFYTEKKCTNKKTTKVSSSSLSKSFK